MFDDYPQLELTAAIIHGAVLAIGLIAPLGIQNTFVINQGASHSRFSHCLPSVITAAICDSVLILLAVCGVSLIVMQIAWLKLLLFIGGFVFVIYMGYQSWTSSTASANSERKLLTTKQQIFFALSVSILNPHAIIDSMIVIGTNSLEYDAMDKVAFAASCIVVSWIWFFSIALAGHQMNKLHNKELWIARINRFAALLMWTIAFYLALQIIDDINDLLT